MDRRGVLLTTGAAAAASLGGFRTAVAQPWQPDISDFDKVLGEESAPVSIVEYASFTCGACATFHTQVFPEAKEKLIDTGKMRLVFRDFPWDGVALRAGMLARCLPEEAYFPFVSVLFREFTTWTQAGDPVAELRKYGRLSGLTDAAMDACLENEELIDRIVGLRQYAEATYNVTATPSFIIGGTLREGVLSYDALARFVEDAAAA